ncbi:MAG: hypothetical protein HC798_00470 [Polaribacter sp.]|nr:hypothetical protein [Polaribacter sp.]
MPFKINRGFVDNDDFTFTIPPDYDMGNLPTNQTLETKFGTYKVEFKKLMILNLTIKNTFY